MIALFSDPNCPFCFATEERLHALGLEDRVRWCGVQHAPHLPVPMQRTQQPAGEDLPGEVASVRALAPELEIAVPPGKPNTGPAIVLAAAALAADPGAGRTFVRSLYRAVWREGADVSDAAVLDGLADRAGLGGLRADAAAAATAATWHRTWQRLGTEAVPLLVREDGCGLMGLVAAEELAGFAADGVGPR